MGKLPILERIRRRIGYIAWSVFLWSIKMTEEEYFVEIYADVERQRIN